MRYCSKCVLPETHETICFDDEGVCNICRQAEIKHQRIDWTARKNALDMLCSKYRGKGEYDCIVPFSGGKDSTFQLWYIVTQLKMKPLVVRYNHWGYRPLVEENNIRTFKQLGVDVLEYKSNWHIVRLLMLESLKRTGDFCWHCHTGVFAHTMQIAIKFGIPLIIFGEAPSEYRAYTNPEELEELNNKLFSEAIDIGITANDMYEYLERKIEKRDLLQFSFPSDDEINMAGIHAIWLGNYIPWNTKQNVKTIKDELSWKGQDVEGIPPQYDYEKIECRWQGIRDYCKYIKRGHGRTNHLACIDIRNGEMTREEGLRLCEEYDGKRPASLDQFLEVVGISEDEFYHILKSNEIEDWGFDKDTIKNGKPLKDMSFWDTIV